MSGCARDANGELLDASAIVWYHDADDDQPISTPPVTSTTTGSRPTRTRIPASKLTGDNSEVPALTLHKTAIRLQQEQLKETAKRDVDMAALGATSEPEEEDDPKRPTAKCELCGHLGISAYTNCYPC